MSSSSYRIVLAVILLVLSGDILLTNGFMLLRVPPVGMGIPINELLLLFSLTAILLSRQSTAHFAGNPIVLPLLALWTISSIHLVSGMMLVGAWAIRDAANMIETGFLFVGYCLASDRRFLGIFLPWLMRILTLAALYILLYPAKDVLAQFSPVVTALADYPVPLFFTYGNPASIGIAAACRLLIHPRGSKVAGLLLAAGVLVVLVVFVQARITYLQLVFLVLLIGALRPRRLAGLGFVAAVAAMLIAVFLASGLQMPGRLGQTFSTTFLMDHIQAIWGGGGETTKVAADGIGMRLDWWRQIHHSLRQDPWTWMFGLGYGMPLTPFHGPYGDVVREPHNSLVSVYGRLGLAGVVLFVSMQALIVRSALNVVLRTRTPALLELNAGAVTLLCFLGVHMVFTIGEGGFEMSFIAVPYYFFAGAAIALDRQLAVAARQPVPQHGQDVAADRVPELRAAPH